MRAIRSAKGTMVDFEVLKMQLDDTSMTVTDNTQTAPLERRSRKLTEASKVLAKKRAAEAAVEPTPTEQSE